MRRLPERLFLHQQAGVVAGSGGQHAKVGDQLLGVALPAVSRERVHTGTRCIGTEGNALKEACGNRSPACSTFGRIVLRVGHRCGCRIGAGFGDEHAALSAHIAPVAAEGDVPLGAVARGVLFQAGDVRFVGKTVVPVRLDLMLEGTQRHKMLMVVADHSAAELVGFQCFGNHFVFAGQSCDRQSAAQLFGQRSDGV